jgi:hypothetical protein
MRMRYIVHNHSPARDAAIDSEFVEAWAQAKSIDPLRYLAGLTKLMFTRDFDQWNAAYLTEPDEIQIQGKFHNKTFMDKVQTLLHEAGHRGQMKVDKPAFAKFKTLGLSKRSSFLAMANQVHQEAYRKNGIEPGELADEVFAESYARFSLGMDMPEELREFWTERASQ